MLNYYETVKSQPETFKHLACKELLFVHYNCPLDQVKTGKWSQQNYFMYVLTGKLAYHTPGQSWLLRKGSAVFVKKGACIVEKFFEELVCIITFFVPDSYLRSFMRQHISLIGNKENSETSNDLLFRLRRTKF